MPTRTLGGGLVSLHVADATTVTTARSLGDGNAREFARVPGLQVEDWRAGG
jgi:hypothetical protein